MHIPRFTVSANDEHFQTISNIVTKLLLFSDVAHKTRLDRLETLLFTYDFTDLQSAATVVTDLQCRIRDAMETERLTIRGHRRMEEEEGKIGLLKLKAHIFLLAEELNLLFDAIKLAQDRFDDRTDQKSALLLHTSSSEISWRMLDEKRNLISKLVVQDINYHWLSRQDSSTVNNLMVGDLTAFDGSRYAIWAEILSKHDEPVNHPLLKVFSNRLLFIATNNWNRKDYFYSPTGLFLRLLVGLRFMKLLNWSCILCAYRLTRKLDDVLWSTFGLQEGNDRIQSTIWPHKSRNKRLVARNLQSDHH